MAAAITLAAGTAIAVGVGKYANGGIPDKGSMFVAGEAGAEWVFDMPNGQSGVMNLQQIAQTMGQTSYQGTLQALKDYGAARGEMPQLQPASDTGIYQAAARGAGKVGKRFSNY